MDELTGRHGPKERELTATKWEYIYFKPNSTSYGPEIWDRDLEAMNRLGAEGWDLAGQLEAMAHTQYFLFKRRLPQGSAGPSERKHGS